MHRLPVTIIFIYSFIFVIGMISPAQAGSARLEPMAMDTATRETSAVVSMSGDIETYLKDINYGQEGDAIWTMPTLAKMSTFADALGNMLAGNYDQAAQEAESIDFQLIQYTDPVHGMFYILRDTANEDNISPGGTYVWNLQARYITAIEAPHPRNDSRTNKEGIELFLASRSSMLLLSGTHRRSDATLSVCDYSSSNDYRRSDPAHADAHLFHVAHEKVENLLAEPLFIQLHGFGSSGYDKLAKQCDHHTTGKDPELLVNVSDTFKDRSDDGSGAPPPGSFARLLSDTINAEGTIKSCLYNEDVESYGGTLNVQGRYTNLSIDPCHEYAETNSGRFIHLEQSYNTRRYQRPLMISLIMDAFQAYFGH